MPTAYIKPPITEAVIELRFGSAVTQAILSRFLRSVRGEYPAAEQMYEVAVQIQTGESSAQPVFRPTQRIAGYKVTGLDSADVIMFGPDRIATIRMAPYFGWEKFISKAKTNFQILQKITGHRSLVRLATRYVNRLDIPRSDAETIRTEEYLLVEPIVPAIIPNIQSFTIQFVGTVPEIESRVIVNAGSIPSPLIDHVSFLLDIDLFREQRLPQRDDDIWRALGLLREHKNRMFEAFITDRARELFR